MHADWLGVSCVDQKPKVNLAFSCKSGLMFSNFAQGMLYTVFQELPVETDTLGTGFLWSYVRTTTLSSKVSHTLMEVKLVA